MIEPIRGGQGISPAGPEGQNVPMLAQELQEPVRNLTQAISQVVADPSLAKDSQTLSAISEAVLAIEQLLPKIQQLK